MSIEEQLSTEDLKSPTRIIYHVEREICEAISLEDYIQKMSEGFTAVAKDIAVSIWNDGNMGKRHETSILIHTAIDMTDDGHLDTIREIESRESFVRWA
jgi:DNA-binding ferritin-like protein (Dps family)